MEYKFIEDLTNCEICGKMTRKSNNPKVTHHVCLACHLNNRKVFQQVEC